MNRFSSTAVPLPLGTTDAHVHVFDPGRYAYSADRAYTPGRATAVQLRSRHGALGIERVVLVQPSVYGDDNAALVDALAEFGTARARGIAVVDPTLASRAERRALHAAGVRGLRLNLEVRHEADPARARAAIHAAAELVDQPDWCLQVHVGAALLPALVDALPHGRMSLVLDHFGGLRAEHATGGEALEALIALLATGRVYVKLSAFYRASADAPAHAALAPLAHRLMQAAPERLLWGSDWPHTGGGCGQRDPARIEPFRDVDLAAQLAALAGWAGDAGLLRRILVDNPAALYGFEAVPA